MEKPNYEITVMLGLTGESGAEAAVMAYAQHEGVEVASVFAESPAEYVSLSRSMEQRVCEASGLDAGAMSDSTGIIDAWEKFCNSIKLQPADKWGRPDIRVPVFIDRVAWVEKDTRSYVLLWYALSVLACNKSDAMHRFYEFIGHEDRKALMQYVLKNV